MSQLPTKFKSISRHPSRDEREVDTINNVYELPSIEQAVRYLHAAAGFPTRRTWLKAIRRGNYNTWPLINVKNVNKHFPESEETQQGHMRSQWQNVRSTKVKVEPDSERVLLLKQHDIFIKMYDTIPTRRENFPSCPVEATDTKWYCTTSIATRSRRKQPKTRRKER